MAKALPMDAPDAVRIKVRPEWTTLVASPLLYGMFIPMVFSKNFVLAMWLQRFGVFVTTFDNGMLRFVVLPGFGLNLLMLSFFPSLVPAPLVARSRPTSLAPSVEPPSA